MNSQEAFKKQEKIIEHIKEKDPKLLERTNFRQENEVLKEIGIENTPKDKPLGFIKLFPQDFIVEEKIKNKILEINSTSLPQNTTQNSEQNQNTLYAKMVKTCIPPHTAFERVAEHLNFNINKIGRAGLKDSDAITAQLVAFPGIKLQKKK